MLGSARAPGKLGAAADFMVDVSWLSLAMFMALVLSVSLYALTASGHFPSEHRADDLRAGPGAAILWLTMAVSAAAAIYAVAYRGADLALACGRYRRRRRAAGGSAAAAAVAKLFRRWPPRADRFCRRRDRTGGHRMATGRVKAIRRLSRWAHTCAPAARSAAWRVGIAPAGVGLAPSR